MFYANASPFLLTLTNCEDLIGGELTVFYEEATMEISDGDE